MGGSSTCFKGVVHAMRLCVLVLLCISATYGRGVVDILRMAERDDYMSDVEETDEGVACDSCWGILNKLDEIKVVIGNICKGDEPEEDDEWIYIQGYYRHAWGHRNFGFNPHQKP